MNLKTLSISMLQLALTALVSVAQVLETDIWVIEPTHYKGIDILANEPTHSARNITGFNPYENQPHFTPGGKSILYTAIGGSGQADVFSYDLTTGLTTQLTNTPESEYSPMITPDGKHISVVRVEMDSTQRLWQFDLNGKNAELLFPEQKQIGYYHWLGEGDVACFLVTEPFTLVRLRTGQKAELIADSVGRCIQKVPDLNLMSYVIKGDKENTLWVYDLGTGTHRRLIQLLDGVEDYAWNGQNSLFSSKGSSIYWHNLGMSFEFLDKPELEQHIKWQPFMDLSTYGVTDLYRFTVSVNRSMFAVVNRKSTP